MSDFQQRLSKALSDRNFEDYEEMWLDAIEEEALPFGEFLTAAQEAVRLDEGERAGPMFVLLEPMAAALPPERKREFYETLTCCLGKDKELREKLLALYRDQYGHIAGFELCIKSSELLEGTRPGKSIELFLKMIRYQPGSFVHHRSGWGVGEIRELDPVAEAAIIDFQKKENHRVKLDALPEICDPLESDHFHVLAWKSPDVLDEMVQNNPVELVKQVLRTNNRPMTLTEIRLALTASTIPTSSWSKWWTRTRNALKKDPMIAQSGGKTSEFFLLDGPEAIATSIQRRFQGLHAKDRLKTIRDTLKELKPSEVELLRPQLKLQLRDVRRHDASVPVLVESLLLLKRIAPDFSDMPSMGELLALAAHPGDLVNEIGRPEDKEQIVSILHDQDPDRWRKLRVELLLRADDGIRNHLLQLMKADDASDEIDALAQEVCRIPSKAPLFFLWIVRSSATAPGKLPASVRSSSPADLFRQAAAVLDRLSLKAEQEKTPALILQVKRYRQHLGTRPFNLLASVLEICSGQDAREIYQLVSSSRGFSPSSVPKVLAMILRKHPSVLASGRIKTAVVDDSVIYSTQKGIDWLSRELEVIRNEKLPEIYKAIGDAAALGDLSENAEFTSAIEERENLNRRVLDLQSQLDRTQVIDLSEASTDVVGIGSRVRLENLEDGAEFCYDLLGPWDGSPEDGILSYQSPLGKALLRRESGEEIEVTLPGGQARYRIDGIEKVAPTAGN